jgi:signal transduction histidine kinase
MSLERKLPLLVIAVLIATLATAVALAYHEVRRSAELAASARIQSASRQLASISAASINERARLLRDVAESPAIKAAIAEAGEHTNQSELSAEHFAAANALHRLLIPTDSALAIELWSSDGQMIQSIGNPPETPKADRQDVHSVPVPGHGIAQTVMPADSAAHFLPFFEGKDHQVYYWMTVPVIDNGIHVGWIAEQSRIKSRPGADRQINGLIGEHTSAFFRNENGNFWTTIGGVPTVAPAGAPSLPTPVESGGLDVISYDRPQHGTMLATAQPVDGTSWWVVLEVERAAVIDDARSLLIKFTLLSLILLIGAATLAWLLIRNAVRPLIALTGATSSMAHGDYSARVAIRNEDEVGRLGMTFNEMAAEVSAAHSRLAGQVEEARRLATERDQAREVAVSASKAKSNFLATMSHEIRTPINAIIGYADILDLEISGPLTPEQHENLRRIRTSSAHLLALVNDVLDLSRIESGTMLLRTGSVATRQSVDAAVALVEPQAAAKQISVTVGADDPNAANYIGDDRGVRQALANLLSNAIKFTNSGGSVTVTWSLSNAFTPEAELDRDSMYVAISIADNGIGIEREKMDLLFQPFTQLEAEDGNPYTRQSSGAGLGLSISRRLARMMGGDITVESTPHRGSTFTLWLVHQPDELARQNESEAQVNHVTTTTNID